MTIDKNILCSNCNKTIPMQKPKRTVLQGLAYEFYWNCPECDYKHVAYYTDQRIRREIKQQEKRWKRYRQASTEEEERKRLAEIKMHDKLLKKDMDALMNRMTETLT